MCTVGQLFTARCGKEHGPEMLPHCKIGVNKLYILNLDTLLKLVVLAEPKG